MLDRETVDKIEYIIHVIENKGHNPKEQLYGYIMLQNPTYITRTHNAREIIQTISIDDVREYYNRKFVLNKT